MPECKVFKKSSFSNLAEHISVFPEFFYVFFAENLIQKTIFSVPVNYLVSFQNGVLNIASNALLIPNVQIS